MVMFCGNEWPPFCGILGQLRLVAQRPTCNPSQPIFLINRENVLCRRRQRETISHQSAYVASERRVRMAAHVDLSRGLSATDLEYLFPPPATVEYCYISPFPLGTCWYRCRFTGDIQANESKPQFKNAYEAQLGNFSSSPPHPSKQRFLLKLPLSSPRHAGSVMAVEQFCVQNHESLLRPLLTQCFLLACTDQLILFFPPSFV